MIRFGRVLAGLLLIGGLLILTGCQKSIVLRDMNTNAIAGQMMLETGMNMPGTIQASLNGKNFQGTWNASRIYEDDVAKRHRLLGSKSHDAYMQGNARDQLWRGSGVLTSADGASMTCEFYYRNAFSHGNCVLNGERWEMANE